MWTGDQNASFERLDGLASNIPGILSVGISGQPIVTTDIAGYNCFTNRSADREVFMRWTELGALLPVMRLHRGNDEICDHWSFDQDRETLDHYKKYALLHTALFPYFYTLSYQAAAKGWPVIRHLMLHYPRDRETWKLDYQFLIGDRMLAAPVWKRDARERELYLPAGEWVHWWSGQSYSGPGWVKVKAGLGEVPLFVLAGRILPLFDGQIDTLVKEDRPDINGWDQANSSVKVLFYGTGKDEYTLWDGARIGCARESKEAAGACTVAGGPVERKYSFDFR
jgi:alpha-glucosidase (family GH31 glycosyl hydrolase)